MEPEPSSDEEELDEDDENGELVDEGPEEEEEGIAQYAPDDWDEDGGDASDGGSGSDSASELDSAASDDEDDSKSDLVRLLYLKTRAELTNSVNFKMISVQCL
jgi:hypothetical protein